MRLDGLKVRPVIIDVRVAEVPHADGAIELDPDLNESPSLLVAPLLVKLLDAMGNQFIGGEIIIRQRVNLKLGRFD